MSNTTILDLIGPASIDAETQHEARDLADLLGNPQASRAQWAEAVAAASESNPHLEAGLRQVLAAASGAWASGQPLLVARPTNEALPTGKVAEMLGYTRSHVVNLINRGILPAQGDLTRKGAHRKVLLAEVLAYQAKIAKGSKMMAALEAASTEYDFDALDDTAGE